MSSRRTSRKIFGKAERNFDDDNEIVSLHAKITARYNTFDSEGNEISERVETTPGRMLIAELSGEYRIMFL